MLSEHEEDLVRLSAVFTSRSSPSTPHRSPAGRRVKDDDVATLFAAPLRCPRDRRRRRCPWHFRREGRLWFIREDGTPACRDDFQLLHGRRSLQIGGDEHRMVAAVFEQQRKLAAGGRLTAALQPHIISTVGPGVTVYIFVSTGPIIATSSS